jgi:hypothetical protein
VKPSALSVLFVLALTAQTVTNTTTSASLLTGGPSGAIQITCRDGEHPCELDINDAAARAYLGALVINLPIAMVSTGGTGNPAGGWAVPASRGASFTYKDYPAHGVRVPSAVFADDVERSASVTFAIPASYRGTGITARLAYTVGSGGVSGQTVRWKLRPVCLGPDESNINPAPLPESILEQTIRVAAGDTMQHASLVLAAAGCEANDLIVLRVARDGAGDTLTAKALLYAFSAAF